MQVQRETDSRGISTGLILTGWGTAQLLPGGDVLTAAHVIPQSPAADTKLLLNLDGLFVEATVLERRDDKPPDDWLLLRPKFASGAFSPSDQPNPIQRRLANPIRGRIRFDGEAFIPQGTTLYAFGFIHAPERDGSDSIPLTSAIIKGTAASDLSSGDPITFRSANLLTIRGMSGGPIAYYNAESEELVVVGVVSASAAPWTIWRGSPTRWIIGCRIPREVVAASQQ